MLRLTRFVCLFIGLFLSGITREIRPTGGSSRSFENMWSIKEKSWLNFTNAAGTRSGHFNVPEVWLNSAVPLTSVLDPSATLAPSALCVCVLTAAAAAAVVAMTPLLL